MSVRTEERELEQAYYDQAYAARESSRRTLKSAGASAASGKNRVAVQQGADAMVARMPEEEEPVAFYLGKASVFDAEKEQLVVQWQLPAVAGYYKATAADPLGLARKRTLTVDRHRVTDVEDLVFADLTARIEALTEAEKHGIDDVLLDDLARSRDGEMRDIVQTIHESQYDLIRRDLKQLLVVQGGPGTGKTAVALHRVSWLLVNHAKRIAAADILVVGPNRTFSRYIAKVLPALGDHDVAHRDLTGLGPSVRVSLAEPNEVTRLKGGQRMARLLGRALHQRIRFPEGVESITLGTGGRSVTIGRAEAEAEIVRLRESSSYAGGRNGMRAWITGVAAAQASAARSVVRAEPATIDAALERIWPSLTPAAFLQDLLGSRQRLLAAAGDDFTGTEIDRLYRSGTARLAEQAWSAADVALLDEADFLLNGSPEAYAHIVVDEAQDLSPMQLRSLRRRSTYGSYTIVGDLAQSTGAWARSSWDDVVSGLQGEAPAHLEELRYGFRVPREVMELAGRLLPAIAPDVQQPTVVRGYEEPRIVAVDRDEVVAKAVEEAREHAGHGLFVGIICPDELHDDLGVALLDAQISFADASEGQLGTSINLMTAVQSKGLEFEAAIVVEPALIAAQSVSGVRELYVALTRTTKHLTIAHSLAYDLLGLAGVPLLTKTAARMEQAAATRGRHRSETAPDSVAPAQLEGLRHEMARQAATRCAQEIRATLAPELFGLVVAQLAEQLEVDATP